MPGALIADLRHFLGPNGHLVGDPPRPIAVHLARIVEAATMHPAGEPFHSAIRCRRRPGRVLCPGYLLAIRSDVPAEIKWECHRCGDHGLITGWQNTYWDLGNCREGEDDDEMIGVAIRPEHYAALRPRDDDLVIDCPAVIGGAEYRDGAVLLVGNASELEETEDVVAAAASRTDDSKRQALLDEVANAIEIVLLKLEDRSDCPP